MQERLRSAARELLWRNTQTAFRHRRRYTFTSPSPPGGHYPTQWTGWDSQAVAHAWVALGAISRAREELESIFFWQNTDDASPDYGFIPHVVFWNPRIFRRSLRWWHYWETEGFRTFLPWTERPEHTRFIQPPMLAEAVERVWLASHDRTFLEHALPYLERYYRHYLAKRRDPDHDGLISVLNSFETGCDYNPMFLSGFGYRHDRYRRLGRFRGGIMEAYARWPEVRHKWGYRYNVDRILAETELHQEDVLVNAVFIRNLYAVARLANTAMVAEVPGHNRFMDLSSWANAQIRVSTRALIAQCWDAETGLFWNVVGNETGADGWPQWRPKTIVSLMPLIIPGLPRDIAKRLVEEHLLNENEFWTPYPVPSVAIDENVFDPNHRPDGIPHIWTGGATMITNWLLARGLAEHGYATASMHIGDRSRDAFFEKSNGKFVEFRNPFTGEPTGDAIDFSWDTLLVDL